MHIIPVSTECFDKNGAKMFGIPNSTIADLAQKR